MLQVLTASSGRAQFCHAFDAAEEAELLQRRPDKERMELILVQSHSITDVTVLVVGLGDIGLHFARLASALGARVIGLKRSMGPCPEGVHELHTMDELDNLIAESGCCSFLCTVNSDYISYVHKRTIDGHEGHCHLLKQRKGRRSGFRSTV